MCYLPQKKVQERKTKMKVEKTIELPDGRLTFTGVLEGEELDAVITYGLSTLLALGVIKPTIMTMDEEDFEASDPDKLQ